MARVKQSEQTDAESVSIGIDIEKDTGAVQSVDTEKEMGSANETPKRSFSDDDEIECKSICVGKTNFIGKSGQLYVFLGYGDTEKIKYRDLKSANSAKSAFLYKPMILIQDNDAARELKLLNIYRQFLNFETPEDFFNLPLEKMREKLTIMPDGLKETIKNTATKLIQENALDSLVKIRLLDEMLGTEFVSFM